MQATETAIGDADADDHLLLAPHAKSRPAAGKRASQSPSAGQPPAADAAQPRPRRWRTTVQLLALLRPFRGSVALLLALSLGAVMIEIVPPLLQGYLIDHVLQPDIAKAPQAQLLVLLASIVAGLLLVRLAASLVGAWKGRVSSIVGTSMTANLRDDLVRKLNELPLSFYDRNQTGALMSQVAYDTETLHTLVYHATSGVLLQALQLASISVALVCLNPKLALLSLLPMPLIFAGSWYFTRFLQPRHHHYWEAVGKQAASLMGMLSGIRVVKCFVQEDREIRRFNQSSRRLRDSRIAVDTSTSTFAAATGFLFALGTLAAWYLGGRDVLFGSMKLGALTAFLQYLAMFYTPLTSIAESTTWFANFFSVSRRVCDLLDTPAESECRMSNDECRMNDEDRMTNDKSGADAGYSTLDRCHGRIELKNVTFGYSKNRPVLNDVSFTVLPGEMVGIVGRSGSGKSTLVSLIGRLYDADDGEILIDGVDVRQLDRRELRRHIGMVPQEPFLFRGTVADNLAYGSAHASAEQVLQAAKLADAHDFVMRMPLAYSTQLGEGGAGLSGGERQRLSIARALLFDPAILILDEATASVDAESERAICRAIRQWACRRSNRRGARKAGRTALVIAHRLSTLQDADRLLVFDQGRLVEQGTQRKLLAHNGVYSTLLRLQCNLPSADGAALPNGPEGVPRQFGAEPWTRAEPDVDSGGSSDDAGDCGIAWLDPDRVKIAAAPDDGLRVAIDGTEIAGAFAAPTLPAAFEDRFLSLRCREGDLRPAGGRPGRERELGLIRALDDWPPEGRAAVRRSLARRCAMRQVREIRQIRTVGNRLAMTVATDRGPASLRLEKPGEGAQPFGADGLLLTNYDGCYYLIPHRGALPKGQQRLLSLYFGD